LESNDPFDVHKEIKKLMLEKGIDNVRRETYTKIELDEEDKRTIERERREALNL
jgi:hypothetical protein